MQIRIARHTNDLSRIQTFYCEVLNLQLLGRFENHQNYSGIFLGIEGQNWHLEFTASNELINHQFNEDDLLVLYPSTHEEFRRLEKSISDCNILIEKAKNPYWNMNGLCIKDPDGYGIIISPQRIK